MRHSQIDKSKMAGNCNVGKTDPIPHAPGPIAQHRFKCVESCLELLSLTIDPCGAALCFIVKAHFVERRANGVHAAVRQCLPAPYLHPAFEVFRNETRGWILIVNEVGNQWRANENSAIVQLERGDLPEWIHVLKLIRLPQIDQLKLVFDTLLEQQYADLSRE